MNNFMGLKKALFGSLYGYVSILGVCATFYFLLSSYPWILPVLTLIATIPFMLGVFAQMNINKGNNLILELHQIIRSRDLRDSKSNL